MFNKTTYEVFHKETKSQVKIINESNFTYSQILSVINKHIKPNSRILDIGCGAGTLSLYFANKGNRVTGVDISSKAIKTCKITSKNLGLENRIDFINSNFPSKKIKGRFDFVICSEVIEHLKNENECLKEITKVMSSKGILFISTPSVNAPLYKLGFLKKFDYRVGHLRRYEMKSLILMLEQSGFKVIETKKREGILRNFLFTNNVAGQLIRFFKSYIGVFVNFIDSLLVPIFGESDLMIVARKSK